MRDYAVKSGVVRLRVCGYGSPVPAVGVCGALMALVRSRWGRGGAREENQLEKAGFTVGRNTSPATRVLNAPHPHRAQATFDIAFISSIYSRGR